MENYGILGRIGEGAHGVVLKAKHIVVSLLRNLCLIGCPTNEILTGIFLGLWWRD